MARLTPLDRDELPDLAPLLGLVEQGMGFVPNSLLVMGRWPELVRAFGALAATVLAPRRVDPSTKQLVAFVASRAAGCRYCQAHTAHGAARSGVPVEKLEAAFEFETDERFSERERAALRLARDASVTPAEVDDAHFEALRRHYDEDAILELVAVIALFGWLNRWNDTLATPLEAEPLRFARRHLAPRGWEAGEHVSGNDE
jgi:uncharacterized peroxidase-related enzyme